MDDILNLLDDTTPVNEDDKIDFNNKEKKYSNNNSNYSKKSKKENLYENADIEGKPVEIASLARFNRMVCMIGVHEIDDTLNNTLVELASDLFNKGFTLRNPIESNDTIINIVRPLFQNREQTYLPWKKFNKITEATLLKPSDCAYYHAAYYHKAFKKLPNAVRAIISRTVNVVLGEDCKTPINMLICYSKDGADNSKEVNFKTTGNISFIINLCSELNIPVFNLGKEGTKERLVEFLKTFS